MTDDRNGLGRAALITAELETRVPREPDHRAESEAFRELSASLASGSAATLDTLVTLAHRLCQADSAGATLVTTDTDGTPMLSHISMAGELAREAQPTTRFSTSMVRTGAPVGAVRLLRRPAAAFPDHETVTPMTEEVLAVPITAYEREVGAIWVATHSHERQFDNYDVHLLRTLAQIASAVIVQRDALAAANEAVSQREELLSVGSHELRNPLTTVVGFASRLARRNDLPEDALEEVRLVARESGRLRRIIDDFFDLAKLESSAFSLAYTPVDLVELLHEQVSGLRMRHPGILVEEEFEDVPEVRTDPSRVAQILGNLLENAAKYGGEEPHITTRLEAADRVVHIEVSDRGIGIPIEEQTRIFDRSYRLNQRGAATREGLGIGLYIARELARRLGGSLDVESTPNAGSTFTLTLPLEA